MRREPRQGQGPLRKMSSVDERKPSGEFQPPADSEYCRVIVRIRERTHQDAMRLLSESGPDDNLSALVDNLLTHWLVSNEAKRPSTKRKKARK